MTILSWKSSKILILALLLVLVSGCTLSLGGTAKDTTATDGGVFRSVDGGLTWTQPVLIPTTTGAPASISNVSILNMIMDPLDHKALYLATIGKGILYSYDQGNNWQVMKDSSVNRKNITTIVIDPKNKCRLYTASNNKIFRTEDCGRSWEEIYSDDKEAIFIMSMVVDHYDSAIVYAVTSKGNILKSSDYGISWQSVNNIKKEIRRIVIDKTDSRILFVACTKGEIYRSKDAGATWVELKEQFDFVKFDKTFRDLAPIPSLPGGYLLATKYGLLKTANYGDDWTEIKLLTPKREATINSVAVDYLKQDLIYYVTDSTYYRSQDGGQSWSSVDLPTTRRAWRLLTDPKTEGLLYLATRSHEDAK